MPSSLKFQALSAGVQLLYNMLPAPLPRMTPSEVSPSEF